MKVKLAKGGTKVILSIEKEDCINLKCIPAKDDTLENRTKGLHANWITDSKIAVRTDYIDNIKWGSYASDEPHGYKDAVRFLVTGELSENSTIRADGTKMLETNDVVSIERTDLIYEKHNISIRLCVKKDDDKVLGVVGVQTKYDPLLLMGDEAKQKRDTIYDPIYVYTYGEDGPVAVVMPVTINDDCLQSIATIARDIIAIEGVR